MVFVDYTLDQMLRIAGNPKVWLDKTIIDGNYRVLHKARYRFLFWVYCLVNTKSLSDAKIKSFDFRSPLTLALENAYIHGHNRDPSLPITVRVYKGRKRLVAQVRDTGEGFDVEAEKKRARETGIYGDPTLEATRGNGFNRFHKCDCLVSFEDRGSVVNILSL